jgi:hypothetical protein
MNSDNLHDSPPKKLKKNNRRGRGARREKDWKIGMMECWNIGEPIVLPTLPLFHFFFLFKLRGLRVLSGSILFSSSAFLRMLGHSHGDPQGGLEGSDIRDSFPGDIMSGPGW